MPLRFGLAANRRHHEGPDALLFRWLKRSGESIRALELGLHAVGRTFDVIESLGRQFRYRIATNLWPLALHNLRARTQTTIRHRPRRLEISGAISPFNIRSP